jgi:cell division protein FtsB
LVFLRGSSRSWLALLGILVIFSYLLISTISNAVRNYHLHQEQAQLEREIAALERRYKQLDAVESYLRSEEYIEFAARRYLGYKRPGESMAIVTTPDGRDREAPPRALGGAWWESFFPD